MNSLAKLFLDACEASIEMDISLLNVDEQDDFTLVSFGNNLEEQQYQIDVTLVFHNDCDSFDVYVQREVDTDDKKQNYNMFFRMNKLNKKYRGLTCYMDKKVIGFKYVTNVHSDMTLIGNTIVNCINIADEILTFILTGVEP